MTETHKAAVEALEALLRHYGAGKTERECSLQNNAFQAIEYFRTLKQPSSVEVTAEEFARLFPDNMITASIWYAAMEKHNLRITRAAATDGVGNGET